MGGPSHAFLRVLQGKLTPERYTQILKRYVNMVIARRGR